MVRPSGKWSGRQDLNLRPPGPQPERLGGGGASRPGFIGFLARELRLVSLSLIPVLIPEHTFCSCARAGRPATAQPEAAEHTRAACVQIRKTGRCRPSVGGRASGTTPAHPC